MLEPDESSPQFDSEALMGGSCGVALHPHQRAILHRCLYLEGGVVPVADRLLLDIGSDQQLNRLHTRMGILGDKAGSGKSYAMLALVLADAKVAMQPPEANVRTFVSNRVALHTFPQLIDLTLSVLVVPHTLMTQWRGYIETFGGGLAHAIVSRKRDLAAIRAPAALEALDLLVVTSTFHNDVAAIIGSGRRVKRVFYDEADTLVIPSCCWEIKAGFHWFATASWRNMTRTGGVRSTGFIRKTFGKLCESVYGVVVAVMLVVKNKNEFVDASISLPTPVVRRITCKTPLPLVVLQGIADRSVIECMNAGDIESALMHICPSKRNTEDNIVSALMEKMRRKVHNLELHASSVPAMAFDNEISRAAEAASVAAQLSDMHQSIQSLVERVTGSDMCCICYEPIAIKTIAPCCSNAFCFVCINRWLMRAPPYTAQQQTCPLCKHNLPPHELLVVTPEGQASSSEAASASSAPVPPPPEALDKLQNLEAILRDRCAQPGAAKMLICTSFDGMLAKVMALLDRLGISHRFLKGNHFAIDNMAREYREGGVDVLLINTKNYGSGINLENTTDVVMLHGMNIETERQVIGRAQRAGRQTPLRCWYLLYGNEHTAVAEPVAA